MKIRIKELLIIGVAASTITGCKKSNQNLPLKSSEYQSSTMTRNSTKSFSPELIEMFKKDTVDINKVTTKYYVDGVFVNYEIDSLENKFPIFSSTKNINDSSAIIIVRTFTTEEKYFRYGDDNGLKLRESSKFDNVIYKYAKDNRLVESVENGGEIPNSFFEFQETKFNEIIHQTPPVALVPSWLTTYDDIVLYGSNKTWPSPMVPYMFGWKDKIGSFKRIHTYSIQFFYDRSFFSKRLGTLSGWGLSEVSFASGLVTAFYNNRIASMRFF